ncbi:hypothetical protein B0T25DRAFT_9198 [Lasiosphaeria hispida]|uniref:Uncharacterized protein n=1 Tax=Lasiosphaeria hispida TaxID=260671 RepID=A0AAJ0MJB2_9PEZI|nr:hypothetical protein B0T25DRAFT_9198 [Lasiosphaeria hispida]
MASENSHDAPWDPWASVTNLNYQAPADNDADIMDDGFGPVLSTRTQPRSASPQLSENEERPAGYQPLGEDDNQEKALLNGMGLVEKVRQQITATDGRVDERLVAQVRATRGWLSQQCGDFEATSRYEQLEYLEVFGILLDRISTLRKARRFLDHRRTQQGHKICALQKGLKSLREKLQLQRQQTVELQTENSELVRGGGQDRCRATELCQSLQELEEDYIGLEEARGELERKNWELRQDLKGLQQVNAGLTSRNSALEDQSRKYECNATVFRRDCDKLEKENARLGQKNADLEYQVSVLEEVISYTPPRRIDSTRP